MSAFAAGFADPVFESQRVFRATMQAFARPGSPQAIATGLVPPAPLSPEAVAVLLALADHETPLWLDAILAGSDAPDFLRFHTGAPIVLDPSEADFALVSEPALCPPLSRFAQGVPEYPERSTTLILSVATLQGDHELTLGGPGIAGEAWLAPSPLPDDFVWQWAANGALYPRGIDCLLVAPGAVAGLPRTTRVERED